MCDGACIIVFLTSYNEAQMLIRKTVFMYGLCISIILLMFWWWCPNQLCNPLSGYKNGRAFWKVFPAISSRGVFIISLYFYWYVNASMDILHIEGILPKGPYLPCVSMVGRALLAGYPRYVAWNFRNDKLFLRVILKKIIVKTFIFLLTKIRLDLILQLQIFTVEPLPASRMWYVASIVIQK